MGEFINCSFCLKSINLDDDDEYCECINCSNDTCDNILCGDCQEMELTYCKNCVVDEMVLELDLLKLTNQIDNIKELIENHQIYFDTDSESDVESDIDLDDDDSDSDFIFNRQTVCGCKNNCKCE